MKNKAKYFSKLGLCAAALATLTAPSTVMGTKLARLPVCGIGGVGEFKNGLEVYVSGATNLIKHRDGKAKIVSIKSLKPANKEELFDPVFRRMGTYSSLIVRNGDQFTYDRESDVRTYDSEKTQKCKISIDLYEGKRTLRIEQYQVKLYHREDMRPR